MVQSATSLDSVSTPQRDLVMLILPLASDYQNNVGVRDFAEKAPWGHTLRMPHMRIIDGKFIALGCPFAEWQVSARHTTWSPMQNYER